MIAGISVTSRGWLCRFACESLGLLPSMISTTIFVCLWMLFVAWWKSVRSRYTYSSPAKRMTNVAIGVLTFAPGPNVQGKDSGDDGKCMRFAYVFLADLHLGSSSSDCSAPKRPAGYTPA